ncbi:MAG TPA: hypothetical protein VGL86_22200 [Polyangia bacterium]|jgi:hypothetical protein
MRAIGCALVVVCAGCAPTLIPLGAAVPVTDAPPRDTPLELVTRSSAADPLPLLYARRSASYGDLEVSLGHAVATASVAWAEAHRGERPDGWQLVVELVQARAENSLDGVITVTMNVRATLRARMGHEYLAQTQAHCKERGLSTPERAAPLFYGCMMAVGRELAGWLGGVKP